MRFLRRSSSQEARGNTLKPKRGFRLRNTLKPLFLVIFLGLSYWCWGEWETRRFDREVAALSAAGEPTSLKSMIPVREKLGASGDEFATDWPFGGTAYEFDEGPNSLYERAHAMLDQYDPVWRVADEISNESLPLTELERQSLFQLVSDRARALALIDRATTKGPAQWEITFREDPVDISLSHLGVVRSLANFVRLASLRDYIEGRHADALRRAEEIMLLARVARPEPFVTSYLVYSGCDSCAAWLVVTLASDLRIGTAEPSDASPRQVRAVIERLLDDKPAREALRVACQANRAETIDAAKRMAAGQLERRASPDWLEGVMARPWVMRTAFPLLVEANRRIPEVINATDWQQCREWIAAERTLDFNQKTSLFRPILHQRYDVLANRYFQSCIDRQLAATALAIRWYACEHEGRLPPSLDVLVPRYLPSVPADLMATGAPPLRYFGKGATPIVYSVGLDGLDDGGSMERSDPTKTTPDYLVGEWQRKDVIAPLHRGPRTMPPYVPQSPWRWYP